MKNSLQPFGNPDGARADLNDVISGFVTFSNRYQFPGLSTKENELEARVIVGRKGSGKTVYLRRMQASASKEDSLFAVDIINDPPSTASVIKFSNCFEMNTINDAWTKVWKIAILRTIISHFKNNEKLKNNISAEELEVFKSNKYKKLIRDFDTPVTIYGQIQEIIRGYNTKVLIKDYIENSLWEELEFEISEIARNCPPMCFYLDGIDEYFDDSPMHWLRCQQGLFLQTMNLLRNSKLGGRLHIFIAIRDLVFALTRQSEHSTKYITSPYIRNLDWNKEAITLLLSSKVAQLEDEFFIGDFLNKGKTVETWLGCDKIISGRKVEEPIIQYLIRHTRLLPRDIVILGNSLCTAIMKCKNVNLTETKIRKLIRTTVGDCASQFGDEQLAVCANQLISNMITPDSIKKHYFDTYTPLEEYTADFRDKLKKIIKSIVVDRFGKKELDAAKEFAKEIFGEDLDPFSVMWQNGLLGYSNDNKIKDPSRVDKGNNVVFYSETPSGEFKLPNDKKLYVFHSSIIDCVGISGKGTHPIVI